MKDHQLTCFKSYYGLRVSLSFLSGYSIYVKMDIYHDFTSIKIIEP